LIGISEAEPHWQFSMADRNKTELTQNVTRIASLWLNRKGFKPVETEVCVEWRHKKAWIADVAGVIAPTQTELIDLKLIRRPPRCGLGAKE
jgi:hypothetical protein